MIYFTEKIPKILNKGGIIAAIDWAMNYLNLPENTHVNFKWKNLDNFGETWDEEFFNDDYYKIFNVEINKGLDQRDCVLTLFHELTHVKQISDNRLKYVNNVPYWNGKSYDDKYYNQPWEFEAEHNCLMMMKKFNLHHKENSL